MGARRLRCQFSDGTALAKLGDSSAAALRGLLGRNGSSRTYWDRRYLYQVVVAGMRGLEFDLGLLPTR